KGLLLAIGLLGLYVEFKTPGFGVPGTVGIACLTLVFFSSYLAGLATIIEILIIVAGVMLLALEVFVIPGFGIPGIAGLALIITGILLSFQNFTFPKTLYEYSVLETNIIILVLDLVGVIAGAALLAKILPRTKYFSRVILSGPEVGILSGDAAVQTRGLTELVGKTGTVLTALRPTGKADVEGQYLDVVSEGDFIEKETKIRISKVEGNRVVVEPVNENIVDTDKED
ncbi:MAG: NfeD family protein, partial [Planctomycetota bacterium]